MRIKISNGHVIDPSQDLDRITDIFIAAGKIVALHAAPDGYAAERIIDASGQIVIPGIIDLCARLREPGQEPKANIASETTAAAHAGITTLCVPPDTDPVIDTPAVAELIARHASYAGKARVLTLGAMTQQLRGQQLAEMGALKKAGCVGISNANAPIDNTLVLRRAMDYAATHDLTVFIKPIDHYLAHGGCAHEGTVSTRLGLPGISAAAETIAVARHLVLIELTGVRAHFCQLSCAKSVQSIGRAQYDGLPISADVAAHHLHLTEMDITRFDSQCHVLPPLRSQRDRDGLRAGVAKGVIAAICSDHQPHEADAKLAPFSSTEPGISALETLLPLTLRLVTEDDMPLKNAVARLTTGPARILGIDGGSLAVGRTADVCIFDLQRYWTVSKETLTSRGRNSPFIGWELQGLVTHSLLRGRLVHTLEKPHDMDHIKPLRA